MPPQTCEYGESHDDLAVAIQRNSSNIVPAPQESSKSAGTLPSEALQRDNMQSSAVTGDKGRLGNLYMCPHLHGTMKTLITLSAKLKA